MSKNYWQQKLQSSLQQSLQTVNSTVSSISSDGAARCGISATGSCGGMPAATCAISTQAISTQA